MKTTDPNKTPPRRRIPVWLVVLVLALIPSGYLYVSGRLAQRSLLWEVGTLTRKSDALADSLDSVRTHLVLGAASASLRLRNFESAQALTSDFFDGVDRRTRSEGITHEETEARLELLAYRDQAISALSRKAPEAGRILEELAKLHLALAHPELKAQASSPRAMDSLRRAPTGQPRRTPLPDTDVTAGESGAP